MSGLHYLPGRNAPEEPEGFPYQGYVHHNDGHLQIIGLDGWCHDAENVADALDAAEPPAPALDVPTIDVAPESVTDQETGQRELDS